MEGLGRTWCLGENFGLEGAIAKERPFRLHMLVGSQPGQCCLDTGVGIGHTLRIYSRLRAVTEAEALENTGFRWNFDFTAMPSQAYQPVFGIRTGTSPASIQYHSSLPCAGLTTHDLSRS